MSENFEERETEKIKREEIRRYIGGLNRYTQKGIPIFMDGKPSGPMDWERLFEVREDGLFYMGDYVHSETGQLQEIRFDKVYLCERDLARTKKKGKDRAE